jgi:hypothetical protein
MYAVFVRSRLHDSRTNVVKSLRYAHKWARNTWNGEVDCYTIYKMTADDKKIPIRMYKISWSGGNKIGWFTEEQFKKKFKVDLSQRYIDEVLGYA